jgi:hypothetical protein
VKYVLCYDSANDAATTARLHSDEHRALWDQYRELIAET